MPKKIRSHGQAKQIVRAKRGPIKRLFMHPTMTFGLLVVGVFLAGLTYHVAASDYSVNAVVEAPPLQVGATITDPVNDQIFTTKPITVKGHCPDDSYVKLSRNSMFSGAAICNNSTFEIVTDLFEGLNDLQAQAYNITDQPGPVTPQVQVTYIVPTSTQGGTTGVTSGSSAQYNQSSAVGSQDTDLSNSPLMLSSDYHFNVATTSELFEWSLQYHTGTAPYGTRVEWGDGTKSTMTVPSHDPFKISHRYAVSGYYPIIVTGTDANHKTVVLQLVAFIKRPGASATRGSILSSPTASDTPNGAGTSQSSGKFHWLVYALPTYGVVSVMALSFWLGERREFLTLAKAVPRAHHRLVHR